jgi:hypothetical protein
MSDHSLLGVIEKRQRIVNFIFADATTDPRSLSENERFFARSRKAKILTARIHGSILRIQI